MSKYVIIGKNGFLGSAVAKTLPTTEPIGSVPTSDTRILFYLSGHVHPVFNLNPELEARVQRESFKAYLDYCAANDILFLFASSALVYESEESAFSKFKLELEHMAGNSDARTISLRIFPTYGPGETRTFISQSCRLMMNGCPAAVYGDGEQKRDFIYITDAAKQIVRQALVPEFNTQHSIVNIGAGKPLSFNRIVETIAHRLGYIYIPKFLQPKYVKAPEGYRQQATVCVDPGPTHVSIEEGIRYVVLSMERPTRFDVGKDFVSVEVDK